MITGADRRHSFGPSLGIETEHVDQCPSRLESPGMLKKLEFQKNSGSHTEPILNSLILPFPYRRLDYFVPEDFSRRSDTTEIYVTHSPSAGHDCRRKNDKKEAGHKIH